MWVHLAAAVIWIGGMLFQALVLRPATAAAPELAQRADARFRPWRWLAIVVLIATGGFNLIHEGGSARLESAWGGVLLIKLLLVAIAAGLAGVRDFVVAPGARGAAARAGLDAVVLGLTLLILLVATYLGRP